MAIISSLYFAVIATVFVSTIATDYCNVQSCKNKEDHTMCKYNSSTPAAACGQWIKKGLSNTEKNIILNKHNELRQKIASGQETCGSEPEAVHMSDLTWDDELQNLAQRWVDQCGFGHDECRNVDRFVVSQNIGDTYSPGENTSILESIIQMWYDEICQMDRNNVSKYNYRFHMETDNYSPHAWADQSKIGCGLIEYKNSDGWNIKSLVCNYGISRNWDGEKIYEVKN